jgi:hypothetical protein
MAFEARASLDARYALTAVSLPGLNCSAMCVKCLNMLLSTIENIPFEVSNFAVKEDIAIEEDEGGEESSSSEAFVGLLLLMLLAILVGVQQLINSINFVGKSEKSTRSA